MTADEFIENAYRQGQRFGIEALEPNQRLVFLIAEAEVLVDMEGIDSFLDRYSPIWLPECAMAFEAVGAVEIGAAFRVLSDTSKSELAGNRLHELIGARQGYDYEAIRRVITSRLSV